ncbi:hypothetical protein SDC9_70662 [bioreactor metagenome]|uniref:Uncharacterized protein n=1 Tax=bioreactor metagenome TaxID=1076179 RepID=A0A644Y8C4_9ZZZZ
MDDESSSFRERKGDFLDQRALAGVSEEKVLDFHGDTLHQFCSSLELSIHLVLVFHFQKERFGLAGKEGDTLFPTYLDTMGLVVCNSGFTDEIYVCTLDAETAHQECGCLPCRCIVGTEAVFGSTVADEEFLEGEERMKPATCI